MGIVHAVTDATFETDVLKSDVPVVVDFWAEWCGPCRNFGPVFEETATDMQGRVKFVKMNVDESPETPGKLSIRGIPTVIAFKGGAQVAVKVGGMTKSQFTEWVQQIAS